ncbi:DUF2059 domain-containing protein [Parachlamydia sp. AcF125]|uniref:DUF2059 domain-containing protein n=1 Tax=Parachlamydia sp. AcF125 TaxID=2795736 RepID=UPI001BC9FF48|nr:DUF2059 domain-containing protein [Parachlamydia sp. AcF125]MBS4169099.1 hypothetical protein [Parachlamydia sp. AcF125]
MGKLYKGLIKHILIIAFFTSPLVLAAGKAEWQAANELLDTIHFEKMMEDSIDASIEMVKQMDPAMGEHEATLRKFYEKYMSAESLRQDILEMYCEIFTEKELKDIAAFYRSKTGQKALEKTPEIMQHSLHLAQTRVLQHMDELQQMLAQEQAAK